MDQKELYARVSKAREDLKDISSTVQALDRVAASLREDLKNLDKGIGTPQYEDAIDHLQQIHFRLTEIKGHLSAIKYNLQNS